MAASDPCRRVSLPSPFAGEGEGINAHSSFSGPFQHHRAERRQGKTIEKAKPWLENSSAATVFRAGFRRNRIFGGITMETVPGMAPGTHADAVLRMRLSEKFNTNSTASRGSRALRTKARTLVSAPLASSHSKPALRKST